MTRGVEWSERAIAAMVLVVIAFGARVVHDEELDADRRWADRERQLTTVQALQAGRAVASPGSLVGLAGLLPGELQWCDVDGVRFLALQPRSGR